MKEIPDRDGEATTLNNIEFVYSALGRGSCLKRLMALPGAGGRYEREFKKAAVGLSRKVQ